MSSNQRWEDAQRVEQSHQYHSYVRSEEDAKNFVEKLNIDYNGLKEKNIIAIGSGSGRIHNLSVGNTKVGIDPLSDEIFDENRQSNAELLTGVGESIPIRSNTFDIALNVNVLDHCKNPRQVLSEIKRILKRGGKLLSNVNIFGTPNFVNKHLGKIDPPHPHHFNQQKICNMISESGFEIEYTDVDKHGPDQASHKLVIAMKVFKMRKINLVAIAE
ncbi:class I SAM-dependent methyltransferase [Halorubrum ezzemoulense]|uniref:class I SAM-dependent methyltransferase n=1 Tax=Halorubrum ezzemoulense TaxID=337243 RepID=UPI00232AEA02|nr:class I SAM-dependent methyltransferase [Halorubrum ezzemoulense]MDB9253340.1 class I SAM-dependent methyltransferase [Halorubrum ezzemoulense]MDB9256295.1 class I SAM-dependent methyltransferase [Halorubrum ezzemoulense]MDB9277657.1 class I SAM-dependent methyltransferase [Halorubrum ezzemoulense]